MNAKEIERRANEIRTEVIRDFPHYASRIAHFRIEASNRMTRAAGRIFSDGRIRISVPYFSNPDNIPFFKNTVLHELAHAIAGLEHGHDQFWKSTHIGIGGNGKRCHTLQLAEGYSRRRASRTLATCPACGHSMELGPTRYKRYQADVAAGRAPRYRHGICPK